ncbi:MAG: glutathione S-transferase N-terminal domain-containing protein [Telluria sp.]
MKLYIRIGACSLSPHIACQELDVPVELVRIDKTTNTTPSGEDFFEINANGYVPVLELDSGERLIEGPAIVQYLADLKPERGLAPPNGTLARTRLQTWLNFIATELHKPMAMLLSPRHVAARELLLAGVSKRLDWLSQQMSGPYLAGDSFSVADPYLFACLNWSPWIQLDLDRWPVLQEFMRRVGARPAVQRALRAEGLSPYGSAGIFYAPTAS